MATLQDLEIALANADAAGDTDAAQHLAGVIREQMAAQSAPAERSTMDELGRQAGLTVRAVGEGAAGFAGVFADPIGAVANKVMPDDMQFNSLRSTVSSILSEIGVPQPENATERLVQAASQALVGGGATPAIAGVVRGATPVARGVVESLAAQPAAQVVGGAASGAGAEAAREAGASPAAQMAASVAAGMVGAKATSGASLTPSAKAPAAMADAERAGIPVMTSDIKSPQTFAAKWLQATSEQIPMVGTGGARRTQQAARANAVRDVLRDFDAGEAAISTDRVMSDLASKRAGDLAKYTGLKTDIVQRLSGVGKVPINAATSEVDKQIASLSALKTEAVQPVVARLEDFKAAIQDQDLGNIEMLRKQLGESFKAPEMTAVRTSGEKVIGKIYGALREDITGFIKKNGDRRDVVKWQIANNRLAGMAGELKMGALKSTLARGEETPEVVNRLLFSSKPSEVRALYSGLTPQGRANARASILARAAQKAGGIDNISPEKFASEVKKLGASVGVMFGKEDQQRLDGLMRALDLTRRASVSAVVPPTGVQVSIPVMTAVLADLMGGGGAALATAGTVGTMARVYESPAVRNALLKLPTLKKGSTEEAQVFKRLISSLQAVQEKE